MIICSGFLHWTLWFSAAMLNYQRVVRKNVPHRRDAVTSLSTTSLTSCERIMKLRSFLGAVRCLSNWSWCLLKMHRTSMDLGFCISTSQIPVLDYFMDEHYNLGKLSQEKTTKTTFGDRLYYYPFMVIWVIIHHWVYHMIRFVHICSLKIHQCTYRHWFLGTTPHCNRNRPKAHFQCSGKFKVFRIISWITTAAFCS